MKKRYISNTSSVRPESSHLKLSSAIVLSVFFFMILCSVLVCMRIYGLKLGSRTAILQSEIIEMKRTASGFKKDIIALSAPSVVYEYASKNLGMSEGAYVGVVKVRNKIKRNMASSPKERHWVSSALNTSKKSMQPK